MKLSITADTVLERYGSRLRALSDKDATRVMMRALNRGGDMTRTQIKRSLVKQTGVKYGLINRAVSTSRATPKTLAYTLVAVGNETNLGLFSARQQKKGVSAAPWGKRRIFKGSFIVGAYGGRVYKRQGAERYPLDPLFGPNLAREILRDPTVHEWHKALPFIAQRLEHELGRMFASLGR